MSKWATLSLLVLLATGCGRGQGPSPISSPEGSMLLETRVEQRGDDPATYLCVTFEVRDRAGCILHTENTRASNTMRWKMSWVSENRIRLESSDIGTRDWSRQSDGRWVSEPSSSDFAGGGRSPG